MKSFGRFVGTAFYHKGTKGMNSFGCEIIKEADADGNSGMDSKYRCADPAVYPATESEIFHKFCFLKEMLEKMGVPVIDDEMTDILKKQIQKISDISNKMP